MQPHEQDESLNDESSKHVNKSSVNGNVKRIRNLHIKKRSDKHNSKSWRIIKLSWNNRLQRLQQSQLSNTNNSRRAMPIITITLSSSNRVCRIKLHFFNNNNVNRRSSSCNKRRQRQHSSMHSRCISIF